LQSEGETQSGSKDLECGFFGSWKIIECIKWNAFMWLSCLNPNG
jgi:hypothetical protein